MLVYFDFIILLYLFNERMNVVKASLASEL